MDLTSRSLRLFGLRYPTCSPKLWICRVLLDRSRRSQVFKTCDLRPSYAGWLSCRFYAQMSIIRSVLDNSGSTLVSRLDYYVSVRGELFYRLGLVVVDVSLLGALVDAFL